MAKVHAGILDGMSGKVGNIVARMRQGTQVYAVYQPNVLNPNTEAQQSWRWRFSKIVAVGRTITTGLNEGFKNVKKGGQSGLNLFMKYNVAECFTGTWPNLTLAYSKLIVARGDLDLPFNPAATASETAIMFTWTDNSGIGNASSTDKAYAVIYNKSQSTGVSLTAVADRSTATYSYTFPSAWAGDEVELYFFMRNNADTKSSQSVYLGNLTL